MSDTYDPVEYIRVSQPANDALLAHRKSHPDYYYPERGLVFTNPNLPPESFERMVTLTISAKHAWRICGYLSVWEANDDWTRDAYEEFRAALEAEQ